MKSLFFEFEKFLKNLHSSYQGPVLVYNMLLVKQKIQMLKTIGDEFNCLFLYALKACGDDKLIRFFIENEIGFDISNNFELKAIQKILKEYAMPKPFISVTGPLAHEISGLSYVDVINASSVMQMDKFRDYKICFSKLGLRINFDPTHEYVAGIKESRFGINNDFFINKNFLDNGIRALHVHQSGCKKLEDIKSLASYLYDFSKKLKNSVEIINLGGGFYYFNIEDHCCPINME